ncbi:NAD-dependent epimerase/dehydratase family protein [Chromobacterium haemolyticum]|uniref:NAD-dependent epimerase/dehydratase family protein n=1 Tax=Chromobacterium TaxID=535 RepID=UPI0006935FA9|nr:NAD(P)-dependent oxidoreductase [Chromobacterium haemolyticum]
MNDDVLQQSIREDCLVSLQLQEGLAARLAEHRIAVIGGTGFIGTWIAETVAALNDKLGDRIRVDLLGRSATAWKLDHPHLASRKDVRVQAIDVRSSFELPRDTTLVLFAAGIADPRVHASEPLRVHETALHGMAYSLAASARLELLQRFVNISSGLVLGTQMQNLAMSEENIGVLDFTRAHNVYAEVRRAAENLVSIYASQYRIPVSTARAFTFLGPYQSLDAPWAVNNFIRDALSGNDIRLHGDGATRRSYLYGSDAACWLLRMLVDGQDGEIYNLGAARPTSHAVVAEMVAARTVPTPSLVYKSQPTANARCHDFFPDLGHVQAKLGLKEAFDVEEALERAMLWHARRLGVIRRLRH